MNADVFIGSFSSIYVMVSSLRYAREIPPIKNHTCVLSLHEKDKGHVHTYCECDVGISEVYTVYHGKGGHSGGVSFPTV